ncbi:hypothetical protein ACFY1U_28335 [Streptomyces sp. NPDC001351]|uniref:hypothetical protein n=1 Tax=Streptomyces sp. NPDC001351 TaxID=3364564 RepID=UPI0036B2A681
MAAVIDLARPALLWAKQPHLRDWFFRGYGRGLSEDELLVLGHASVLASGEDLLHAIQLRDTESIAGAAAALRHSTDQSGTALDSGSVTSAKAQDGWS